MSHDVFVCHSSQDRIVANAIVARLEARGIRCWIAPRDVVPGREYAQSIIEAIGGSRLTVLVFSAGANSSPHVRRELERTASHGIPILPFRVEAVVPAPSVEYFISDAHWLDAMTPPLEQHLEHLVGTVRLLLDRQGEAAAPSAVGTDAATPAPAYPVLTGPAHSRSRWMLPAGIAVVVTVIGAAVLVGLVLVRSDEPPPTPATQAVTETEQTSDDMEFEFAHNFTDGFDVDLRGGWSWVNEDPTSWRVVDSHLEIDAAQSPPMANVLLRPVPDAPVVVITTLVRFEPTSDYQFAGIVLTGDDPDSDRIQFGRAFCDEEWCSGDGLYLDVVRDGELVSSLEGQPVKESTQEIHLGLELHEDVVIATYDYEGGAGEVWNVMGDVARDIPLTRIGLAAHQAPDPITAVFDWVSIDEFR